MFQCIVSFCSIYRTISIQIVSAEAKGMFQCYNSVILQLNDGKSFKIYPMLKQRLVAEGVSAEAKGMFQCYNSLILQLNDGKSFKN